MTARSEHASHGTAAHAAESRPEFLAVLGINPPATVDDVKQAYLAKVKTAHPDVGGDPADFLRLQEAFEQATQWAQFRASRLAWLSTWVEKYVEQDSVIHEIEHRGGRVQIEGVDWLRRSFGEDFSQVAEKISRIELHGPRIDDAVLDWLTSHRATLGGVRSLDLSGSRVTDAGLQHVAAFPSLRELNLSDTKVTGAGLIVLDWLPELQRLIVRNTSVGLWTRLKLKFTRPKLQVSAS